MGTWPEFWNPEVETLSRRELDILHEKKLMKQLDYVWANSAFYKRKFQETGGRLQRYKGSCRLATASVYTEDGTTR